MREGACSGWCSVGCCLALQFVFAGGRRLRVLAKRTEGLRWVIWSYTGLTALAGLLVWFLIPEQSGEGRSARDAFSPARIRKVLSLPSVWLIAVVVICAYCGFKAIDNYAVFVVDAYGMTDVEGPS